MHVVVKKDGDSNDDNLNEAPPQQSGSAPPTFP